MHMMSYSQHEATVELLKIARTNEKRSLNLTIKDILNWNVKFCEKHYYRRQLSSEGYLDTTQGED